MLESLKERVANAHRELNRAGLIRLTWGSVSGIDRQLGLMAITPVGLSDTELKPQDHFVIGLNGKVVQPGAARPSPDAGAHLEMYRAFPWIGGITHTHSPYATMFAQAILEIPCMGAMHASYFRGPIPLTRELPRDESDEHRDRHTGLAIVEKMKTSDPRGTPGLLVPRDGPFAWGPNAMASVENAKALEAIAEIAFGACLLGGPAAAVKRA